MPRYLVLFFVAIGSHVVQAQEHCAKVSTDVTFYFGIEAPMPDPNHPVLVDHYHTDLELSFRPYGWDVVVSYDHPDAPLDLLPVEALLVANSTSRVTLFSIPASFAFIGAWPGEPFWVLQQSAVSGSLPLGIAVEEADVDRLGAWNPEDDRGADTEDLWFEMALQTVRGPADANFAMWQVASGQGPTVFMSTHDGGITEEDVYYLAAPSHTHVNWAFTQPGLYEIDFCIATVLRCDPELTADWAPLGHPYYQGDGWVNFLDFAHMAQYWGQAPTLDDPNTAMFVEPNDPEGLVHNNALLALTDQWLDCGYPGCM